MWKGNDAIFKTYVRGDSSGDGKKPLEKVKGRDHISSFDEVRKSSCFGGVLQAGIVDISFDSKEMYESFLEMAEENSWKCLALPSPKGGHTYWRCEKQHLKNGKDKKLTVGLIADIHSGSTYIPLCVHGKKRFPPDYDKLDDEDYQEVPEELLPVSTTVNLWRMEDGEGRNQEIFRYIQRLQSAYAMPQDVITRILKNANEFVLADPLPEEELNTITRDESFAAPVFFDGKTFLHNRFADWMMEQHHIVRINDQLHIYKNDMYVPAHNELEKLVIEELPTLKRNSRAEAITYIQRMAPKKEPAPARYAAFRNGILDIDTGLMKEPSADLVITNRIPWNYNPAAYHEEADKMLDRVSCDDPEIRLLLEECIGYCFYRSNIYRKAFILTGGKRGGKSTYLDCIKAVLGKDNISSLDLKEVGDRFSTAMMFGKLANIGDDIGDDFLQGSQVATFKKIVAGNTIKAERKGQDPFDFDPYCKLLFSANEVPRMRDRGSAVMDRLILLPFNAVFTRETEGYDPKLKDKLLTEEGMEYFVRIGVEGLKRVLANKGFSDSAAVNKRLEEYEEENNPILAFVKDLEDVEEEIINEVNADVYQKYTLFCHQNGYNPVGTVVFSRNLCKMLNLEVKVKKINGKSKKIYIKSYA